MEAQIDTNLQYCSYEIIEHVKWKNGEWIIKLRKELKVNINIYKIVV